MIIKFAVASDDLKNLTTEHFGEAKRYLIYSFDLETGNITFLEDRKNTTTEEETHGDSKKAKAISEVLGDISVLINLVFGPNIIRIKKRFVVVVSRVKEIKKVLEKLKLKKEIIEKNLNKKDKEIIYLE